MAADTQQLLSGILNVVSRTEKHIAEINKNLRDPKGAAQKAGIDAAVVGGSGANKKDDSNKIEKKLDTIIDLLEASLTGNSDTGSPFKSLGIGINTIASGLSKFKKISKSGSVFVDFIQRLEQPLQSFGSAQVSKGVKNLKILSTAIVGFSKNMFKAGMLLIPALPVLPVISIVIKSLGRTFDYLGEKSGNIRKGARTMQIMGSGMMFLAGGIALFTLSAVASSAALSKFGFPTGAVGMIAGMVLLFAAVGKSPAIRKGVRTMRSMGLGMLALSAGIAILSLTFAISATLMKSTKVGGMLGGGLGIIAAIGGLAVTMIVLGLPVVAKGARTMRTMGLGMLVLAGGIAIMGLTFAVIGKAFGVSPLEVGVGLGIALLGMGFAMSMMGKMSKDVLKGAFAVAVMSLSFIAFAYGLKKTFEAMKGQSWEDIGKMGTVVLGLALVVTLIGNPYTLSFTLLGAAALGAIGIGLYTLAKGIQAYTELGALDFPGKQFEQTMKSLRDGLLVLVGDDDKGGTGVFGALKSVGKAAVSSSKLSMAILNAIGIGQALSSMAKGIGAWANLQNIPLISGYDKEGMPIYSGETANVSQAVDNILTFVGDGKTKGILLPFIKLSEISGIRKSGDFSVMKLLVGNDFSQSPFMAGIASAVRIGKVLTSMAKGVGAWANLQNIPLIEGYDKDGKPIYGSEKVNIDQALGSIDTFIGDGQSRGILVPFIRLSEIGGLQKSGFSVMKLYTGNDLSQSPFMAGISAAVKIGKVLTSIAQGIGTWANLQNIPLISGYDKNGNPTYDGKANVQTAMDQINTFIGDGESKGIIAIFKKFTDSKDKGFSVLKLITGNDLSLTPMQRGIANALKIGQVLTSLGEGIGTFANLQNIPLISGYDENGRATYNGYANVEQAIENAGYAIQLLGDTFVKVAGEPEPTGGKLGGWLGLTKNTKLTSLSRAVKAMAPVGDLLAGLAQGIKVFANLENIKLIDHYEWNEKAQQNVAVYSTKSIDVRKAIDNAGYTIELLGDTLARVAGEPDKAGGIAGWLGFTKNAKATSISRAAKAMAPVGDLLAGLAQGINTFANLENIKLIDSYRWDEKSQQNVAVYSDKSINVKQAIDNAGYTIELLGDKLAKIAGEPKDTKLFGWRLWSSYPKAKAISRAAKALAPVGEMLGGLAEGMKTFANISNIKIIDRYEWKEEAQQMVPVYSSESVDSKKIADNVVEVLKTITGGLATLMPDVPQNTDRSQLFSLMAKSPDMIVRKAVAAISGIGEVLSGLGSSIETFANINNIISIIGYDDNGNPKYGDPINIEQISNNAVTVIKMIFGGLAELMPETQTDNGSIINAMANSPDKTVRKGVAAMTGVGELLSGLASSIKTFADLSSVSAITGYDKDNKPIYSPAVDVTSVADNIKKVLVTTFDVLAEIGEKTKNDNLTGGPGVYAFGLFTKDLVKLSNVATDFEKFANSFGLMSTSMGKFVTEFKKMSPDSIDAFTVWTKSLTDFADLSVSQFGVKLEMVKKAFGSNPDGDNIAEEMNQGPGAGVNFHKTKTTEGDDIQNKKDKLMLSTLDAVVTAVNNLSSKLDDTLSVHVVNTTPIPVDGV